MKDKVLEILFDELKELNDISKNTKDDIVKRDIENQIRGFIHAINIIEMKVEDR